MKGEGHYAPIKQRNDGSGGELITNPKFEKWRLKSRQPDNLSEICAGWYIEVPGGDNVPQIEVYPFDPTLMRGVSLQLIRTPTWVRLWQPVKFPPSLVGSTVTANLTLTAEPKDGDLPALDWIALLRENAQGKRVFGRKLHDSERLSQSVTATVSFDFEVEAFQTETSYFVIQFSGTGLVNIQSCEILPRQTAAHPSAPASPVVSAEEPVTESKGDLHGEISSVGEGKIAGRLNCPPQEVVFLVMNRAIIEEIPSSGTTERSFSFTVNQGRSAASSYSLALYSATSKQIVPGSTRSCTRSELFGTKRRSLSSVSGTSRQKRSINSNSVAPAKPAAHGKRVAVVSWDMGHNPVGRAFLLADMASRHNDVHLVGPLFPQYGGKLWPPIADTNLRVTTFEANDLASLIANGSAIAEQIECDVVYVGKPRLPSLLLGALIRRRNNCPLVLDVDDHELGFVSNQAPASLDDLLNASEEDFKIPYSEIWTRFSETLVAAADMLTVSNIALQKKFGGIIVRHGRDESLFNPKLYNRDLVRAEFGFGPTDKVILFLGTPRAHKGIFNIADALEVVADPNIALCIIGTINDKRISGRLAKYKKARIYTFPDQPWSRLPELVTIGDAVFILQDPASAISEYQIPAKLTDALALGVEVFVTPVPPLEDVIAAGAVHVVNSFDSLIAAIKRLSEEGARREQTRQYFLTELSYRINASRIQTVIEEAFEGFDPTQPDKFQLLFDALEKRNAIQPARTGRRSVAGNSLKRDLVFLWKQNDSDLYGRRSDMLVKYLRRSGRIGRVIHFDAPISSSTLLAQMKLGAEAKVHQGNQIVANTVRRSLAAADADGIVRRTFIYREGRGSEKFLGLDLPSKSEYLDFVIENCELNGIGPGAILWVSPVVFDFPEIQSALSPSLTIADIIDDQRKWHSKADHSKRVIDSYAHTLTNSDVVLANCDSVAQGFSDLRNDILVVPNGAEFLLDQDGWEIPSELAEMQRPIIGYVGNLRDRVDIELIDKIARRFESASIVLIGSAHDRPEVLELEKRGNVHLLGVKPYPEAVRFIKAFDVAMMPHLANDLSDNMNPLKLYVYFSLGVPTVTTEVANIGDIAPYVAVASSHEQFIEAIDLNLRNKMQVMPSTDRAEILRTISWEFRVQQIWNEIDKFEGKTVQ